MKIAFVTDDGITITQHLGHRQFHKIESEEKNSGDHSHDNPANHSKHVQMMAAIEDCDVVICGGMGRGAYNSIVSLGKEVFMTNTGDINEALKAYLVGELPNMSDLVH